jgi:hypothetical protein
MPKRGYLSREIFRCKLAPVTGSFFRKRCFTPPRSRPGRTTHRRPQLPLRYLAVSMPLAFKNDQRSTMALNSGLRKTDTAYIEMEQIIRSPEGRKAAIDATQNILPALCAVDRLLREKLGDRYKKIDRGTVCAGAARRRADA